MLRFRRYRIFWILAVFIIGALYHFKIFQENTIGETDDVGRLRNFGLQHKPDDLPATTAPEKVVSEPLELGPEEKDKEKDEEDERHAQEKVKGEKEQIQKETEKEKEKEEQTQKQKEKEEQTQKEKEILENKGSALLHNGISDHSGPPRPTAENSSVGQQEKVAGPAVDVNVANKSEPPINDKPNASSTESSSTEPSSPAAVDTPETPGKGRLEVPKVSPMSKIYWSKLPEHFPVPSASIIQLPTGKPKSISNIQHLFSDESANEKIDREQKLNQIKETFEFSWTGYKDRAWMKDELSPVSGDSRDPFCGWAATLVDSLDTLWIMGMKEDFEKAVNSVKDINFTTTDRRDIPVFETVIRYLGGLLSAYDLSGVTYRVLLDKAVELAEVLMGAFDTPNRMPIGYYLWKPAFASQPHRARARTVLAELGSLSVEFTRLAQLTGEPKYYDAVARITNELATWQNNTKLPGLWPLSVDASGCKKPDASSTMSSQNSLPDALRDATSSSPSHPIPKSDKIEMGHVDDGDGQTGKDAGLEKSSINDVESVTSPDATASKASPIVDDLSRSHADNMKRDFTEENTTTNIKTSRADAHDMPACEPQGLASPPGSSREQFSLGGQADSVYEYLPKEYMLLGGLEDGYRRMYEMAVETAKTHLLFRPMLPEDRNVLLLGTLTTSGTLDDPKDSVLQSEGTHLTCFAGGMFAIGAKIFNRDNDLDIARKLTDGCVWAYGATLTGMMPERYLTIPCESQERCDWDETMYRRWANTFLAPAEAPVEKSQQKVLDDKNSEPNEKPVTATGQSQAIEESMQSRDGTGAKEHGAKVTGPSETKETRTRKRQLADLGNEKVLEPGSSSVGPIASENVPEAIKTEDQEFGETKVSDEKQKSEEKKNESEDRGGEVSNPPPTPTSQDPDNGSVTKRILPIGMVTITSPSYILRPEAIESVFIMYRITGDNYWREVGWTMFEAIRKHTAAKYGASGIEDVTSTTTVHTNVMESFWLAETLKYFYLLFSDPDLINLDEYILNTEAHPFRRPK